MAIIADPTSSHKNIVSTDELRKEIANKQSLVKDGLTILQSKEHTTKNLVAALVDYVHVASESTSKVEVTSPGANLVGLAFRKALPDVHDGLINAVDSAVALGVIDSDNIQSLSDDPTPLLHLVNKLTGLNL